MHSKSELLKQYFANNPGKTSQEVAADNDCSIALAKCVAKRVDYHFTRKEINEKVRKFRVDFLTRQAVRQREIHEEFLYKVENKMGEFAQWSCRIERAASDRLVVQRRGKYYTKRQQIELEAA